MTLVVAGTDRGGRPYVLSDSLLTADMRGRDGNVTTHLIERSIKTYIVRYQHRGGEAPVPVDISFGVAGNISLGLQSLLFVEARVRAPRRDFLSSDQLRDAVSNDLGLFWKSAADKTVEYACAWIHPDDARPRLFRARAAPGHHGHLDEVASAGGVLLTAVGDDAEVAEREVRAEATAALYAISDLSPHGAHFASAVRVLRRWMRDENRAGVGAPSRRS